MGRTARICGFDSGTTVSTTGSGQLTVGFSFAIFAKKSAPATRPLGGKNRGLSVCSRFRFENDVAIADGGCRGRGAPWRSRSPPRGKTDVETPRGRSLFRFNVRAAQLSYRLRRGWEADGSKSLWNSLIFYLLHRHFLSWLTRIHNLLITFIYPKGPQSFLSRRSRANFF